MYTKGCQNKAMKEKIPKSKFLSQVISLKSKHKQVQVFPTLYSSFLLCKSLSLESIQQIQLFSLQKHKVIYQTYLPRETLFGVIEDSHLVIGNISKNVIDIHSLKTGQITSIEYNFLQRFEADLIIFQKTKIFCIAEMGGKSAKITFYSYKNIKEGMKNISVRDIKYKEDVKNESNIYLKAKKQVKLVQLNDESKIALVQSNIDQISLQIFSFQFDQGHIVKENMQSIKVDLSSVNSLKDIGYFFYQPRSIIDVVWQFYSNQYLVIANILDYPYYFFLKTNYMKDTIIIQPLKLTYYRDPFDISKMELVYMDFNGLTVFREIETLKIVFADLKRREVVDFDYEWGKTTEFSPKIKDKRIFIEYKSDPEKGKLQIKMTDWTLETKSVFLHFLLELNEDFDDDLLQDSIDLLF